MAGRSKPVFGVGIKGSLPSCVNGKKVKSYMFWCNMLQRCYSDKYQNGQPTYIGCTVCDEWTNYANFKSWFDRNYINGRQKRFGLYNSPLEASSAYIKEKSKHIRDKALDYYNNGLIPKNIQVALNSWQVGELSSH